MKKRISRVLSLVLVFAFVIMGCTLSSKLAKAEDTTSTTDTAAAPVAADVIRVYYYNENKWDAVNIWSWTIETTADLAKNAWPGDPMKDEGNGWYSAEITSETENIGVLFTDNSGNQTADVKELSPGKTYWVTNGTETLANDSGMGGGVNLVLATEPKAGWPEGPAADTTATSTTADSDKNNDSNVVLYVVIAVVVVVAIIGGVVLTKKKKGNK